MGEGHELGSVRFEIISIEIDHFPDDVSSTVDSRTYLSISEFNAQSIILRFARAPTYVFEHASSKQFLTVHFFNTHSRAIDVFVDLDAQTAFDDFHS